MNLYTYSQCASFEPNPKNTPTASIIPMMSRRNISGYTGITIIAMMITMRTHILYNLENTNLRSSAIAE